MKGRLAPFLKWAGGKRWIMESDALPVPTEYARYIEPFLGSGAVYFGLEPSQAILADSNEGLIELFEVVRDSPRRLWRYMVEHQAQHCSEYYYAVRETVPRGKVQRAARFLYLNRTCWNGLYRVNKSGVFNVPKGSKSSVIFDTDDFAQASHILQGARMWAADFEETFKYVGPGDFVFVDPPYTVKHNLNNFLKYNENIFSWEDQVRLRDCVEWAGRRGAYVVVTNADHKNVKELYKGFSVYSTVDRHSRLAADKRYRRPTTEAVFKVNI